jgi:MFS family permease
MGSHNEKSHLPPPLDLSRWSRLPAVLMIAGGVAALVGAGVSPKEFGLSWLLSFLFYLSLALGALFLVMVHHLTDAGWSVGIRRFCEHLASLLFPWLALLFVPVLLLAPQIYHWLTLPPTDELIRARWPVFTQAGFAAALPAIAGFVGGVLGGILSDMLLRKGMPLSVSRKIPIVVGLVISCAILLCNFTDSQTLVLTFMAIAFFGKGVASLGWAVMSDAAPREATGLSGSIFNLFGNAAGIFTPIAIAYILNATGNNWDMALLFVFAHSIVAMVSYLFIAGEIKRVVLRPL